MPRFDAVLFDAGGVLVLPDPTVIGPLLARYGGSTDVDHHRRAHYAAMKAKSDAHEPEGSWQAYDDEYVDRVGVDAADRTEASFVLGRTRTAWLWRWMIPETRVALDAVGRCRRAARRRVECERPDRSGADTRGLSGRAR